MAYPIIRRHIGLLKRVEGNVDLDKDGFGISNSDPLTAPMVV
jgi:hypothetical protein